MKGFKNEIEVDRDLRCRWEGCRNRWTIDCGHGRLCSHHDDVARRGPATRPSSNAARYQAPIPLREAVRPFAEPSEPDEEYTHHG